MSFMILNKTTGNVLSTTHGANGRFVKPWLIPDREAVDSKVRELLLKNPTEVYAVFELSDVFSAKVEVVRA